MHEVGLAQRIVEIALRTAADNGGGRVTAARVLLGQLTCVEPETLTFAFELAARGTAAEGCRLDIVRVPARLRCPICATTEDRDLLDPCTTCGQNGGELVHGRELRLDSIDLDEDEP